MGGDFRLSGINHSAVATVRGVNHAGKYLFDTSSLYVILVTVDFNPTCTIVFAGEDRFLSRPGVSVMDILAQRLKGLISLAVMVGPLMLCALPACDAAVMTFPDAASSAPIGLDQHGDDISDPGFDAGVPPDDGLLPDMSARPPADDIVNSVLGVAPSENWLEENRKTELAQPGNALTLMKAYVNILNNSTVASAGIDPQQPGPGGGGGSGFLTALAEGITDADTLNLITQVLQPHVENNLVSFSVLGLGQFMLVGRPDYGDLALMDLSSGQHVTLREAPPDRYANAPAPAPRPDANTATFIPNEGETLAQLVLLLLAIATNPMFILTAVCILSIWLLYRLAKRFS